MALYSASYENVRITQKVFYDQLACAGFGLLLMFILSRIDYRKFYDVAYILYGLNIIVLVLVLFSGRHALGATRWIEIAGVSFQPSELTKLVIILALGRYLSQRHLTLSFNFKTSFQELARNLIIPLMITIIPMLLVFMQPDLGTSALIFGIFLVILFSSGIGLRTYASFIGIILAMVPFLWMFLRPYQKDRLLVFLNPNIDPLGAGYTIIQSKIAVGSGQVFGKGWLSGTQNQLNFLPERHTDFIFSVIGEEWGMIGTIFVLFFFLILINSGLTIAQNIKDRFGMLVTVGIVAILTLQVVINVGMVLGLCPVVGLTLPLVSYGRTSFMIFILMIGFLLNLSSKRTMF